MAIQMIPVKSSAISAVGYDGSTVHVEFKSGGTHQFGPVSKSEFDKFASASSLGGHFHKHIRPKAIK